MRELLDIASIRAKVFSIFFCFMDMVPLGVLWLGTYLVVVGELQLGALLAMWTYATSFLRPIRVIVMGVNRWQESIVGVQRVKAYFDEKPEIEEAARYIREAKYVGLSDCPCRTSKPSCDAPANVCLTFNYSAKFLNERQAAQLISPKEALAVLQRYLSQGGSLEKLGAELPTPLAEVTSTPTVNKIADVNRTLFISI